MAKYSVLKTSNGKVSLDAGTSTLEIDTINWKYLKVTAIVNGVKVYINHSEDFIEVGYGYPELILEDFTINHIKFEFAPESSAFNYTEFTYYLLK